MSIWASWPEIGEHNSGEDCGEPDGTVLTYTASNFYPSSEHPPASVGVAHIPGFIGPHGRRDQDEDTPVAPYLRLDLTDRDGEERILGTVVLTRAAVERLRKELAEWLALPMHTA